MRALLIEDDPLLGDGIKTALEREGYTVDWFMLGREAISAIGSETFSVIILDLGLPDMHSTYSDFDGPRCDGRPYWRFRCGGG